jgi:hypothetical protein
VLRERLAFIEGLVAAAKAVSERGPILPGVDQRSASSFRTRALASAALLLLALGAAAWWALRSPTPAPTREATLPPSAAPAATPALRPASPAKEPGAETPVVRLPADTAEAVRAAVPPAARLVRFIVPVSEWRRGFDAEVRTAAGRAVWRKEGLRRSAADGFALQAYGWRGEGEWRWVGDQVVDEAWESGSRGESLRGRTFVCREDRTGRVFAKPIHYELPRRGQVIVVLSHDRSFGAGEGKRNLTLFGRGRSPDRCSYRAKIRPRRTLTTSHQPD